MERLPGSDMVDRGLNDLAAGRETVAALLVRTAAPRLRGVGLQVPEDDDPGASHRLNDLIPELAGWRDRSPFVVKEGRLAVHHFDPMATG